jgi:hypothetical protein
MSRETLVPTSNSLTFLPDDIQKAISNDSEKPIKMDCNFASDNKNSEATIVFRFENALTRHPKRKHNGNRMIPNYLCNGKNERNKWNDVIELGMK